MNFYLPLAEQSRTCLYEPRISVAGMTHQFADPFRQVVQDGLNASGIQKPGLGETVEVRRKQQPGFRKFQLKAPGEAGNGAAHYILLGRCDPGIPASPQQAREGGRFLLGAADARDRELLSQADDDLGDSRQNVHVLVSVEVSRRNTGTKDFGNLPPKLGFHMRQVDLPPDKSLQQATWT